jgi:hypothetical protein
MRSSLEFRGCGARYVVRSKCPRVQVDGETCTTVALCPLCPLVTSVCFFLHATAVSQSVLDRAAQRSQTSNAPGVRCRL